MRMGNVTILFALFGMITCQALAQESPPPESAEEKALKQLQGDWELSEELCFQTAFLADFGLEGLESRIGTRVRVKKDQIFFGDKLDKRVRIQLGTLGDKKLIGFAHKGGSRDEAALSRLRDRISADSLGGCFKRQHYVAENTGCFPSSPAGARLRLQTRPDAV